MTLDFGPTIGDVLNENTSTGIFFFFFSATITLSVILGLFGFVFCVLIAFIIRRYRRFRNGNRRKFKSSDENLVVPNYETESAEENEIFSIRLHPLQNNLQDSSSILSSLSTEDIIQDPTVSSTTTSDQSFSLCSYFRKFLK